jgi:flagellar basal-body rod modification protein FlgD
MTSVSALTATSATVYRATGTGTTTDTGTTTGTGTTTDTGGITGTGGITDTGGITGTTSSSSSASSTSTDQWGKDTFLKLLCAQLKYQDPSNPTDGTQFLSQTAQFTVVEKLGELNSLNEELLTAIQSQLTASQAQEAAALVGRTVTWTDADSVSHTGVVSAANLGTPPTLTVGTETVDLSAITAVTTTPTGSGSAVTTTPTGSGSGGATA